MSNYLEQLMAMDDKKRTGLCEALLDAMHGIVDQLNGVSDNRLVVVKETSDNPAFFNSQWDRLMCLKWLAEGAKIIEIRYLSDYNYIPINSGEDDYLVSITNRYVFEDLLLTLTKMDAEATNYDGYDLSIKDETVPNLAYYDSRSGRGLVNGNKVYLRGRNKRLFNALFLAAPNSVDRNTLLTIATAQKKYATESSKYAVNDAFSAIRKACKVDKSVISLKGSSGKLDAKVFPLSFQFPQNDFRSPK